MCIDNTATPEKLVVLWTSENREVAANMVFMYSLNSKLKGWWEEVCLLVWGPSAKLLAGDAGLQEHIKKLIQAGVEVMACKACSDIYGVSGDLEKLGIEVKYVGEPFTALLKENNRVITI